MIQKLNPVIRGWAMYHRHVVAKAAFSSIDSHIWKCSGSGQCDDIPPKGHDGFEIATSGQMDHRSWDFATKGSADSDTHRLQLFRAMTIPITRHVKIRAPANPFDPEWTPYLIHRRTTKRSVSCSVPHTVVLKNGLSRMRGDSHV